LRRAALLLAGVAVVAGCGSSNGPIAAKRARTLVLQPTDLPSGFSSFYSGKPTSVDVTPDRSDPSRFDRRGGWLARYHRSGSVSTKGPLVVVSRADVFKNAGGAKLDFELYKHDLETGPGQKVSVPKIGRETIAVASKLGSGKTASVTYSIAWRDENATAAVDVNGFTRGLTLGQAVALARVQDLRLRRAAH
jgi:hypothetical protein